MKGLKRLNLPTRYPVSQSDVTSFDKASRLEGLCKTYGAGSSSGKWLAGLSEHINHRNSSFHFWTFASLQRERERSCSKKYSEM